MASDSGQGPSTLMQRTTTHSQIQWSRRLGGEGGLKDATLTMPTVPDKSMVEEVERTPMLVIEEGEK